jgi:hypothetical protein
VKRDIHDLQIWAAFKLNHRGSRHLVRARNVTARIVKGYLTSLVRYTSDGLSWREIPSVPSFPYREIVYWSDTEAVVSSTLA